MFYRELKNYLNYWMSEEEAMVLSFLVNAAAHLIAVIGVLAGIGYLVRPALNQN